MPDLFRLAAHVKLFELADGSGMLLNRKNLAALPVNAAASVLCRRLVSGRSSAAELSAALESAFSVSREDAERDVESFLRNLREAGLLEG
jgi:hypothetical protein